VRAIERAGYQHPTPIQIQAIPPALEGRDVLGCAQTGTGKTAAFVLPLLQQLMQRAGDARSGETESRSRRSRIRALILSPTRELAAQIGESIATYGKHSPLRHLVIFGGVSQLRQEQELARGVDILVATPGRLCDLMGQSIISLRDVEILVLDECDRMLDQGFWPSIRRIVQVVPRTRQTMLFSATMPRELEPLVAELSADPVRVSVSKVASTPERIDQAVWHVEQREKRSVLERLMRQPEVTRAVVFTRTKHGANRVAKHLTEAGVNAEAIHGNKSQNARERAMSGFRTGSLRVLVATDLASRGIDIDDVTHVINFDLPVDPESYVHRIGRTARAGRHGIAVSLCCAEERDVLRRIERLIGQRLPVLGGDERSREPEQVHTPPRKFGHAGSQKPAPRFNDARPRENQRTEPRARADEGRARDRNVRDGRNANVRVDDRAARDGARARPEQRTRDTRTDDVRPQQQARDVRGHEPRAREARAQQSDARPALRSQDGQRGESRADEARSRDSRGSDARVKRPAEPRPERTDSRTDRNTSWRSEAAPRREVSRW
jgi:ATP-dependent RNA helicase RhlE